jgi:hypothetical protein
MIKKVQRIVTLKKTATRSSDTSVTQLQWSALFKYSAMNADSRGKLKLEA